MISEQLKRVILKVLELKEFNIQDETLAYQVPGWDSLSNVIILTAVENEFGVLFKTEEILGLKNLGDLQLLVNSKISSKNETRAR